MNTETNNVQRRAVIGSLRNEAELEALRDPFAEAPFYGFGDINSATVTGLAAGDVVAGVFHGLRQSKTGKKSWYARIEAEGGQKIRLFTPANLKGQLMSKDTGELRVPAGTYIEITYLGMEVVEGVNDGEPIHQLDLKVAKGALN